MEYFLIIALIIALIVGILLFKFIKNLVKTILSLLLITIIVSLVIGAVVYIDTRNFINDINSGENLFFLEDESFISGFILDELNKTIGLSSKDLDEYYNFYLEEEYDNILEDKNKFFVFNLDSLVDEDNKQYVDFLKGISNNFEQMDDFEDRFDLESIAFMTLVVDNLRKNPLYLIDSYKTGNLTIYPESITFKVIKVLK
ncbi:hypothetical protein HOC50_00400 [archaeon]|nr:hypothetical protein [archaeon]MBT4460348.1 hypothetical protein [archaeon]MBT4858972.1 hypothetical protein [archaeon]MBT5423305.1 hypothetical protein [archaeon]